MNQELLQTLCAWFEKNQRDFPWRKNPEPYWIWLVEVMSQQTTLTAALPYFWRFLGTYPHVDKLAAASEEEVMGQWAGLGYYSRARNLHKAAKFITENGWPKDYESWLQLPGVGPYTAAAIVSQAFQIPKAVWDGNVTRVMSRVYLEKNSYSESFKKKMIEEVEAGMIRFKLNSSHVNQGFMELGATVCTPKTPRCGICPIQKHCGAFKIQRVSEFPPLKPRKSFQEIHPKTYVFLSQEKKQKVFLVKRIEGQWYSGLYDFPSELGTGKSPLCELNANFKEILSDKKQSVALLKKTRHTITNHKIHLQPILVTLPSGMSEKLEDGQWVELESLYLENPPVPLSTTAKKVLKSLSQSHINFYAN